MTSAEHARAIFRARRGFRPGVTPEVLPIACTWCTAAPHRPCRDRELKTLLRVHVIRAQHWADAPCPDCTPPHPRSEGHPVTQIPLCPECRTGKCRNCPGWALDAHLDQEVPCGCGRHDDDGDDPRDEAVSDRDDEGRDEIARSTR